MAPEEMAEALRRLGYQVTAPIDQKTCLHPHMTGSGSLSGDGSGHSSMRCPDCGFASDETWGPNEKRSLLWGLCR